MWVTIVKTARPPFLLLPLVCVFLALATSGSLMCSADVVLGALGALLAHISVNMLNEYQDFTSGLDLAAKPTPFSGGSGALPARPEAAPWVLKFAVITLVLVISIGAFLAQQAPLLWWLGGAGVLLIVTYTRVINRFPWLCLIAPGTGFGLLLMTGMGLLQSDPDWPSLAFAAVLVFFLVNNLLLANQFPDREADAAHGRRHMLIHYGASAAIRAYSTMMFLAAGVIVVAVMTGVWSQWTLLALLPWALTLRTVTSMHELGEHLAERPDALALTVVATLATPVIAALGLLIG